LCDHNGLGDVAMTDQWTTAQLNRIAKALELDGYKQAGEFVALAALSVHTVSALKSARKRRMRRSYRRAVAAWDGLQSAAIVVPFPARRRTAGRAS
jgi:hypothetical protein